jgi:PKD repeat protein
MDDDNSVVSDYVNINVYDLVPRPDFIWSPRPQNEGAPVQFNDTSKSYPDLIVAWYWTFGDGASSSTQNPTHIYYDNGVYNVILNVTDDDNSSIEIYYNISIINVAPAVNAGKDQTINEWEVAYFNGSFTDPGTLDTHTIYWDFGDGNSSSSSSSLTPSNHFTQPGNYKVNLRVVDDDGGIGNDYLTVTVLNLLPIVDAGNDIYINEGEVFSFNGTLKNPGHDVLTYYWDFDISTDGPDADSIKDNDVDSTSLNTSHVFMDHGVYTAKLTVFDDDGSVVEDFINITVYDLAPIAQFTWSPEPQDEGAVVQFTDASSSYPDVIVVWYWTFSDSGFSNAQFPTHTFYDNGIYTVILNITDDDGSFDVIRYNITIVNVPPTVTAGSDITINEWEVANFNGSFTDPGTLDTHMIQWDFGDGNSSSGSLTTNNHYTHPGPYNVTLTITDDDGGIGYDIITVTVLNLPPIVNAGEDISINEGEYFSFNGSIENPGHDVLDYYWDFDITTDGPDTDSIPDNDVDSVNLSVSHVYMDDGTYIAKLTVMDDDGSVVVDYINITVLDLTPIAQFSWSPEPQDEGSAVQFSDLSTSYPDDIMRWYWDFADGGSSTEQDPKHIFYDNGVYSVSLTVTDDDNSTDIIYNNITILNVAPVAEAGDDKDGYEVATFEFVGSCSDPGIHDTHTYEWDLDYDGSNFDIDAVGQVVSQTWIDDFNGTVALKVTDDDGGFDIDTCHVLVRNVAPSVQLNILPVKTNISIRIAGEKWHDVVVELYENGNIAASGSLVRYPGSPNEQMLHLSTVNINVSRIYSIIIHYTPPDDPINGQINGATPCWVILEFENHEEVRLHHTFNVKHPETYIWEINLTKEIRVNVNNLSFEVSIYDPGADELTVYLDFGDGNQTSSFYPNQNKTFPVEIIERLSHNFTYTGTFTVTLIAVDDDDGIATSKIIINVG